MSSSLSVLPPRPLRLDEAVVGRRKRKHLLVVLFVVAIGVATAVAAASAIQKVLAARAMWSQGVPGTVVDLSGSVHETTKFGIPVSSHYQLDVEYRDAQGHQHHGARDFSYVILKAPQEENPAVRYLASAPEQLVLSWEVEGAGPWSMAAMWLLLTALCAFVSWAGYRRVRKLSKTAPACAENGEELLLKCLGVRQDRAQYVVRYEVPASDGGGSRREVLSAAPLIVKVGGSPCVVALRSNSDPGEFLVVEESLFPFVLTPAQVDGVRERLERLSA